MYLCNSREVPDYLYPKDPRKRAAIDQYLSWNISSLRKKIDDYVDTKVFLPRKTESAPNPKEVKDK